MSGVEEVLASSALLGLAAEAIDDAHWCESNYTKGCNCREWRERQAGYVLAVVAEHLQPLIRQAQAEAVAEVARAWQINGWADVLLPAPKPPAVPAIAYAQRVTDWLRDRADALAGDA